MIIQRKEQNTMHDPQLLRQIQKLV